MMHAHEFIVATNQELDYATRVRARLSSRIPPTNDGAFMGPVGATGGNQRQIARANEPEKQAKTLAVGCDRLPRGVHGKEGVDGSSPSEGLKYLQIGHFCCLNLLAKSTSLIRRGSGVALGSGSAKTPAGGRTTHLERL